MEQSGVGRLRIVSFNANGIKAALKRSFGTVDRLLEDANADILCIQETKLRRSELDRTLAIVDGWDSFFACAASQRGYSGVATYVRTSLALPIAAEEGFSGCSCTSTTAGAAGAAAGGIASIHPALAERFPVEELQELDSEGRVLITDHGAFVLFNVYGPALSSEENAEERMAFKIKFFQALQCRWENYLQQGRAVLVVGDLNISPAPIDRADRDPLFYRPSHPHRLWLRALLRDPGALPASAVGHPLLPGDEGTAGAAGITAAAGPAAAAAAALSTATGGLAARDLTDANAGVAGLLDRERLPWRWNEYASAAGMEAAPGVVGQFIDVFRAFFPDRKNAFTCWHTATAARVNNYGSRIDLVLAAGLPTTLLLGQQEQQHQEQHWEQPQLEEGPAFPLSALLVQSSLPQEAPAQCGGSLPGAEASLAATAGGCVVWLSGSDIMAEVEGSDHCPVWVDVSYKGRFPCATAAPPCSTRHLFSGKQLKLHGWLAAARAASSSQQAQQSSEWSGQGERRAMQGLVEQQRQQQEQPSSQPSSDAVASEQMAAGSLFRADGDASALHSQPADLVNGSGNSSSSRGGGLGSRIGSGRWGTDTAAARGDSGRGGGRGDAAGASMRAGASRGGQAGRKQASLGSFFMQASSTRQAQHAKRSQQPTAAGGSGAWGPDVSSSSQWASAVRITGAAGYFSGAAVAMGSQDGAASGRLPRDGSLCSAAPAAAAATGTAPCGGGRDADEAAEDAAPGGQSGLSGRTSAEEAADAWRRIQQRMEVPRCKHGEPAVLKKVNKSGENKGRYFYTCGRPAGVGPEGQCKFFAWVNKRPGDFPNGGAGRGGNVKLTGSSGMKRPNKGS